MTFNLSDGIVRDDPFPHVDVKRVFTKHDEELALHWLESGAMWTLTTTSFYEQYEFSLLHTALPEPLAFLADDAQVAKIRGFLEASFCCRLKAAPDVTAHRLVAGQTIRVHNDYLEDGERCRFIVQLNRHWELSCGGVLMLFSQDGAAARSLIPPRSSSGFGFRISPQSNHAVSTVHAGQRFTLVYSFYDE